MQEAVGPEEVVEADQDLSASVDGSPETHAGRSDPGDRPSAEHDEPEASDGGDATGEPRDDAPGDDEGDDESPTLELKRAADLAETVGLSKARYDRASLLHRARMEGIDTRRWWRAMGIVEVPDDVVAFGNEDLAMVRALRVVLDQDGSAEDHVFRLARLLGGSFSRIAEAQTEVLDDLLSQMEELGDLDSPSARAAALQSDQAGMLIELFDQSMTYVWRRHLFAALGRWVGAEADQATEAVGFVDISGFSQMSKRTAPDVLAGVVERFESESVDVVSAHGGRVVKFIGDEAFFVVDDVPTAVDVALDLAQRMGDGEPAVALHTGIACGPTVSIAGDVFGHTVNLAKRLTDVARKGKVVLPKEDAEALEGRDDLQLRRVARVFELKGIGRTAAVSVSRRKPEE